MKELAQSSSLLNIPILGTMWVKILEEIMGAVATARKAEIKTRTTNQVKSDATNVYSR